MTVSSSPFDLSASEKAAVAALYAVRVTPAILETIADSTDPMDPVARQYLPQVAELVTTAEERQDPIGDKPHSPLRGLVHRHPDRVLLMPVAVCAAYCRFCFRRSVVGQGEKALSESEIGAILDYIRAHTEIWEVILTGGDPLMLGATRLKPLIAALSAIPHVQVIRIHSRIPVSDPSRVTPALCAALETEKALYVAVHVNHVQELSEPAEAAIKALRHAGATLVSQTVLLRDVNATPDALEALFRRLVILRVKPYYLHHPDLAAGTSHFRLTLAEGQAIFGALRGRVSGLALPTYVLDIPGGFGKIPVNPCYVETIEGQTQVTDPAGNRHAYPG